MLPEDEQKQAEVPIVPGRTWFMLYFRDGDEVRSELSLARAVNDSGALIDWAERLILPKIDLLDGPPEGRGSQPPDPDIEVPVERRAS